MRVLLLQECNEKAWLRERVIAVTGASEHSKHFCLGVRSVTRGKLSELDALKPPAFIPFPYLDRLTLYIV